MSTQFLKPGWKMVKFGDIAQNVAVRVDPADAKTDVYVGLEHLDPSTLHLHRWGHPSDVTGQKLAFKKGDVIFGRRRAYQRKLAVAEFDGICSAHAMVVRAKPKMILPEFLPFFLQSDAFMERAIEISVGSLSPTINWKTLRVQEFPLPSLEEQKRIAEILWAADDTIEKFMKAREIFDNVLTIQWKQLVLDEQYPKHPLSEFAKFINGYAFKPSDWKDKGIPIIRIQNLNGSQEFNYAEFMPKESIRVFPGDLLFGWSGNRGTSFGPFVWFGPEGALNQHIFRVVNNKDVDQYFLYMILKSMTPDFESVAHGSAGLVHIKKSVLLSFSASKPPLKTQKRIADLGRRLQCTGKELSQHFENAGAVKKSLMQEFSHV